MRDEIGKRGGQLGEWLGSRALFDRLRHWSRARGVTNEDGNTHLNSNSSRPRGTSDTDDLTLQAEEVLKGVGFGDFDRHDCCLFE